MTFGEAIRQLQQQLEALGFTVVAAPASKLAKRSGTTAEVSFERHSREYRGVWLNTVRFKVRVKIPKNKQQGLSAEEAMAGALDRLTGLRAEGEQENLRWVETSYQNSGFDAVVEVAYADGE